MLSAARSTPTCESSPPTVSSATEINAPESFRIVAVLFSSGAAFKFFETNRVPLGDLVVVARAHLLHRLALGSDGKVLGVERYAH